MTERPKWSLATSEAERKAQVTAALDQQRRAERAERALAAQAEVDDAMLLASAHAGIQAGMRAANQRGDVPIALAIVERVKRGVT